MKDDKLYNETTIKVVNRLELFENQIINNMVIGDTKIIEGVEFIKSLILEINPVIVNDFLINQLDKKIKNKYKNGQSINKSILYGIEMSKYILSFYIPRKSIIKVKNNK